jgi:hypothetical protein
MLKSGSDFRFEPEPDQTERKVQVQVREISEPECEVRFKVRFYFQFSERVQTLYFFPFSLTEKSDLPDDPMELLNRISA